MDSLLWERQEKEQVWEDKSEQSESVNPSVGILMHNMVLLFLFSICCVEMSLQLTLRRRRRSYRGTVTQLRRSLRVRTVGPLAQRLGQLSLLHGSADTFLSGCVAAIQPGGGKKLHHAKYSKMKSYPPYYVVFVRDRGYRGDGMAWVSLLLLFRGVRGFSATDTVMQGPASWSVSSYAHAPTHTTNCQEMPDYVFFIVFFSQSASQQRKQRPVSISHMGTHFRSHTSVSDSDNTSSRLRLLEGFIFSRGGCSPCWEEKEAAVSLEAKSEF